MKRFASFLRFINLVVELPEVALKIYFVLSDQVLLQRHIHDVRFLLTITCWSRGHTRIEGDSSKVLEHVVRVIGLISSKLIVVELVVEIMLIFLKVLTFAKFLKFEFLLPLFHPFLILSDSTKEKSILVLLFSILDHLDELMSDSITDTLQKLTLLPTEDRHGILGQSQ